MKKVAPCLLIWYCYFDILFCAISALPSYFLVIIDNNYLKFKILGDLFLIKFCHWNLTGLVDHDFLKMLLIEAFITTFMFDICFSETFLESSLDMSDTRICINVYHPGNTKLGVVCTYYKNFLN